MFNILVPSNLLSIVGIISTLHGYTTLLTQSRDNYRYFSQLIIAFRIMIGDMLALLVLIVVSCSGFFVAFTFSFARDHYSAKDISFALFQMIMGFTPAVSH